MEPRKTNSEIDSYKFENWMRGTDAWTVVAKAAWTSGVAIKVDCRIRMTRMKKIVFILLLPLNDQAIAVPELQYGK